MKKRKLIIFMLIFILIICLCIAVNNIKIFTVTSRIADDVYNELKNKYSTEDVDIYILSHNKIKSSEWKVEKTTNDYFVDLSESIWEVCIESACNPRRLKLNKNSYLDNHARFVVVADKGVYHVNLGPMYYSTIKVKEMVITDIYLPDSKMHDVKFGELNFTGKLNSIMSFIPRFRIHP